MSRSREASSANRRAASIAQIVGRGCDTANPGGQGWKWLEMAPAVERGRTPRLWSQQFGLAANARPEPAMIKGSAGQEGAASGSRTLDRRITSRGEALHLDHRKYIVAGQRHDQTFVDAGGSPWMGLVAHKMAHSLSYPSHHAHDPRMPTRAPDDSTMQTHADRPINQAPDPGLALPIMAGARGGPLGAAPDRHSSKRCSVTWPT